ncbi:MAG: hypothetical protein H6517_00915 [Microthrixaceae bacterium]|nr:hypothetical protein [Microthrixaceae bacterium]MCB1010532.1 hypothetical protein [Microthrixaceae bacterium]MCB9386369.1 hypothetical protein [Microthrixaceae bacterium]MCO5320908.1 hypothetical protein [Microthrixaceae bacterium]
MFGQRRISSPPGAGQGAHGFGHRICMAVLCVGVLVGTACSSEGSASSSTRPRPTDVPGIHDHSSEDSALAPETVLPEDIAALGDGPQPGEQFDVFLGVNVCGRFLEMPSVSGPSGVDVDAAGVVSIAPQPGGPAGHDITVADITDALDISLTTAELGFGPSWDPATATIGTDDTPLAGLDLVTGGSCGTERAEVQLWYYTAEAADSGDRVRMLVTDPQDAPIVSDGAALTIAFAPESSLPTLPPSALNT